MQRAGVVLGLAVGLAQHGNARNIGAVMLIAPADIEADHIAVAQARCGGLNIGHRRALAETDAADHRKPVLTHRAAMEGARQIQLRRIGPRDLERGVDRGFGNLSDALQPDDFLGGLHRADAAQELKAGNEHGARQLLGQFLPVAGQQTHLIDRDAGACQARRLDRRHQRRDGIAIVGQAVEIGLTAVERTRGPSARSTWKTP